MISYIETSALVKMLVDEDGSEDAGAIWGSSSIRATSVLTYTEAREALAAARRAGRVGRKELGSLAAALDDLWTELTAVSVGEQLARTAGELADSFSLRGYDAIHLATALRVSEGGTVTMVTWDGALWRAALDAGLAVAPA